METKNRKEFLQDDGQLRVFIVPVDILDVPDLTASEKLVYIVLRSYVNPTDPTAFPSYETIAQKASLKRRRTIDIVKSLVEKGLIRKETRLDVSKNRKIRNTSNKYTLITPPRQLRVKKDKKQGAKIAPPPVQFLHHPSAKIAPYHNQENNTINNMSVCMNAREELACSSEKLVSNEIYESIQKHVPKNCYIANGLTMSGNYINEIYLMLVNQFPMQLDTKVIEIACNLYRDRVSDLFGNMTIKLNNPVGFFNDCYKDAIKQYKVQAKKDKE